MSSDLFTSFLIPLLGAFAAMWAARESWRTRKETTSPPPTPYNMDFSWYSADLEEFHPEHGHRYEVRIRYRLSVTNTGTQPLRLQHLALLVQHHQDSPATGPVMQYRGNMWHQVDHPDVPKTLQPGDAIDLERTYPEGPVHVGAGLVEVVGHKQELREAIRGDVIAPSLIGRVFPVARSRS